jgi:16S rRNA (adenine1518-N6/adenine1519-N6)-dimethyltransferase
MTVLVQLEVAERIVAAPGTAEWGPLSIQLQSTYRPELGRAVPASLFWPRPAVESAVVRMELQGDRLPASERAALDRLVAELFQHRRQGLARVLARYFGDRDRASAALERLGLDPRERAENLGLSTLRALAALGPG